MGRLSLLKSLAYAIIILIFILVFMLSVLMVFKDNPSTKQIISQLVTKSLISKSIEISENQKIPAEWKNFEYRKNLKRLPYLFIDKQDSQQYQNPSLSSNRKTRGKYLVICHGAGSGNEDCYTEFKQISNQFNISLISLEYPGFGQRSDEKGSETTLMEEYPYELFDLIENELKISWSEIILLGQCLGAVPALSCLAKNEYMSKELNYLILIKPLSSILKSGIGIVGPPAKILLASMYDISPYLKHVYCPVICIQGERDEICSLKDTKLSLEKMENSKKVSLIALPGVFHNLRMLRAFTIVMNSNIFN